MGLFEIFTGLGLQLIEFARTDMLSLVEWFITPIGELNSIFSGTELADITVLAFMLGAGLPLYLIYSLIKYLADIIT